MHIFISGIGGSGLAPLAHLALDCGFTVSGSDTSESLSTQDLINRKVALSFNQNGDFIQQVYTQKPIDWFVYTSAINLKTSAEYQYILQWNQQKPEKQIRVSKRSELLNFILKKKQLKLLAIAGTHGKTTTTAMIVWLFKQLKIPISYSIGTNISFGPSATYEEGSQYFVYECDEFDRNFLDFYPHSTILTSLDYDHPDTYPTKKDYFEAFEQFLNQTDALVIAWQENLMQITTQKELLAFSKSSDSSQIENLKLTGRHNRENGYLAIQLLNSLNISTEPKLKEILAKFPGTQRRFEKLADFIFTDYAHHPKEIQATLQIANEFKQIHSLDNSKIVLIYQPHQNSRQHLIKKDYQNCFKIADIVYWLPTYLTRENPNQIILTPQDLIKYTQTKEIFKTASLDAHLSQQLLKHHHNKDIIVFLGAGTIDAWARIFVANLDK